MKRLEEYDFPRELKDMPVADMELLAYEIRDFLIAHISRTGGHLASNLGIVELTLALHRTFDTPRDKLVWDVGHQSYVHKILTGRAQDFPTLRQFGGLSGFPKVKESEYDVFDTGHSSTSISIAAGMAAARDLSGKDYDIAAIIGDGALTGGMAYEALNNVGASKTKLMVILNDNGMSIAPNTGGVSRYLDKLRSSHKYAALKQRAKTNISGVPVIGKGVVAGMQHVRDSVKYALMDGIMFEELGFHYFGPVDGHNISALLETLELAKEIEGPVFIHVITKKGKGYRSAEETPSRYHGTGPFDPATGRQHSSGAPSYSSVFGESLTALAARDPKIVAISAAMIDGTGLQAFKERFPQRTFDVGIAEEHAVTFAAGLAAAGYRPVVAVYSTFLQRAYDQIMEDVCLQNLPVVFAVDRAGIVGADGETHHGLFDLSYLGHIPNITLLAPASGQELTDMLAYALTLDSPCAIRYPRGTAGTDAAVAALLSTAGSASTADPEITENAAGRVHQSHLLVAGKDVEIWAAGTMLSTAAETCARLRQKGIDAGLVNARILQPLDQKAVLASAARTGLLVTLEDNVITGGFGERLSALVADLPVRTLNLGWPDCFIEHGSCGELYEKYRLDAESITERIGESLENKT